MAQNKASKLVRKFRLENMSRMLAQGRLTQYLHNTREQGL